MPGYKVFPDGGEIREGLACAYCKLVLKDPVQTSESGLRLCRGCVEEAKRDLLCIDKLSVDDQIRTDVAVKKEITNLRVKCGNYNVGCDWKGLFKQLMQHSRECLYVTVECSNTGCGQQVVKAKMEAHLKEECLYRQVNCKDCDQKMHFIELQDHAKVCPNAPKICKNCGKEVLAHKLPGHMIHECKYVRSVCSGENNAYEVDSTKFHDHLQDVSKLADHLKPMICEVTKMSEAFKEMQKRNIFLEKEVKQLKEQISAPVICELTKISEAFKEMAVAYELATERIDVLEKSHQEGKQRIDTLEEYHQEDTQRIDTLTKRIFFLEKWQEDAQRTVILEKKDIHQKIDSCFQESQNIEAKIVKIELVVKNFFMQVDTMNQLDHKVRQAEDNIRRLESKMDDESLYAHQDVNKFCKPTILQFPEETEAIQELSRRVAVLERDHKMLKRNDERIEHLEMKITKIFDERMEALEKENRLAYQNTNHFFKQANQSVETVGKIDAIVDFFCEVIKKVEENVLDLDSIYYTVSAPSSKMDVQLHLLLSGVFMWTVPQACQKFRDAKIGNISSIYSPPFYSKRNGYKMCIKAYLNGTDSGEGTHLSVFFVLMKGKYDSLLQWPFNHDVSLILVDQDRKKDLVQTFKPDPQSSAFKRPKTNMNIAIGYEEFADLSVLDRTSYVKDDVMYIKAIVGNCDNI